MQPIPSEIPYIVYEEHFLFFFINVPDPDRNIQKEQKSRKENPRGTRKIFPYLFTRNGGGGEGGEGAGGGGGQGKMHLSTPRLRGQKIRS
jgi:hypothetical protein